MQEKSKFGEYFRRLFLTAINPISTTDSRVIERVKQRMQRESYVLGIVIFCTWIGIWAISIPLNDWHKPNFSQWLDYRLVVVASICILFAFFSWAAKKNRLELTKSAIFGLAAINCFAFSWSYRLGQPMPRLLISLLPALVVAVGFCSFIAQAGALFLIVSSASPLWSNYERFAWVYSDCEVLVYFFAIIAVGHKIYIATMANKFLMSDLEADRAAQEKSLLRLGRVAVQVAHDIRSPVAALKVLASSLPDAESSNLLRSAIQRIQEIASDLLAEHKRADISEIDICEVVTKVAAEKRIQYQKESSIDFVEVPLNHLLPLKVAIDESSIKRVLSNIIQNSVESILPGCGRIEISCSASNKRAIVTITDTGKGIPKEILSKLMVRGATFGKSEGSGLGLSYAKEILASAGGEISIDSEEGKHTTVRISIPLVS